MQNHSSAPGATCSLLFLLDSFFQRDLTTHSARPSLSPSMPISLSTFVADASTVLVLSSS